jgi:hypothetical protein
MAKKSTTKKTTKPAAKKATGVAVALQVDPSAAPHSIEFQSKDGSEIVGESEIPAFYNFPDILSFDNRAFRFWGRETRADTAVLIYREAVVHVVE